MKNKNVLITGSTAGIGLETAKALAKQGANVYIHGRNKEKAQKAVEEVIAASGNKNVFFFIADLSKQKEVRRLADEVKAKLDRLDVLINNAGGAFMKHELTEDGIETTFANNHLSYFLLTNLLLDLLKKSAPARIVNVASHSHYGGKIDFSDLNYTKNYRGYKAYENSKLGNVLFTLELAERLKGTGVTVNALHPGVVKTDIGAKHSNILISFGWNVLTAVTGISVAKGAETSVYLASSPEVEGESGKYYANSKHKWQSRYSQTEGLKEKLWEVSAKLTGLS
jgi:NAD(P)-dependent dehydrogenase (short-subunit alcohol dehydrogenase family)